MTGSWGFSIALVNLVCLAAFVAVRVDVENLKDSEDILKEDASHSDEAKAVEGMDQSLKDYMNKLPASGEKLPCKEGSIGEAKKVGLGGRNYKVLIRCDTDLAIQLTIVPKNSPGATNKAKIDLVTSTTGSWGGRDLMSWLEAYLKDIFRESASFELYLDDNSYVGESEDRTVLRWSYPILKKFPASAFKSWYEAQGFLYWGSQGLGASNGRVKEGIAQLHQKGWLTQPKWTELKKKVLEGVKGKQLAPYLACNCRSLEDSADLVRMIKENYNDLSLFDILNALSEQNPALFKFLTRWLNGKIWDLLSGEVAVIWDFVAGQKDWQYVSGKLYCCSLSHYPACEDGIEDWGENPLDENQKLALQLVTATYADIGEFYKIVPTQ